MAQWKLREFIATEKIFREISSLQNRNVTDLGTPTTFNAIDEKSSILARFSSNVR